MKDKVTDKQERFLQNHDRPTGMNRREFLKKAGAIGVLTGLGGLASGYFLRESQAVITNPVTGQVIQPGSMMVDADYIIGSNSGTYLARNGATGRIDFTNTDVGALINTCMNSLPTVVNSGSGRTVPIGHVHLRNGGVYVSQSAIVPYTDWFIKLSGNVKDGGASNGQSLGGTEIQIQANDNCIRHATIAATNAGLSGNPNTPQYGGAFEMEDLVLSATTLLNNTGYTAPNSTQNNKVLYYIAVLGCLFTNGAGTFWDNSDNLRIERVFVLDRLSNNSTPVGNAGISCVNNGLDGNDWIDLLGVMASIANGDLALLSGMNHLRIGRMEIDTSSASVPAGWVNTNWGLEMSAGASFTMDSVHFLGMLPAIFKFDTLNGTNFAHSIRKIDTEVLNPGGSIGQFGHYFRFDHGNWTVDKIINGGAFNPWNQNSGDFGVGGSAYLTIPYSENGSQNIMPATFLTVNPPVSGTVYQNTNPYRVEIYLPVTFSPTAGAAATLIPSVGPTNTPPAQPTESHPANSVTGIIRVIKLTVPAYWFYKFVGTNVTIGTATVVGD